ncbi:MAG: peptidoglycan DD-metalloendopeptidase family protein [Lachnospiraceae bacterium]|nr:peptidoglycan DD-metalloendopeptidase family protein [Lachnospiraceae bacterium]
MKKRMRSVICLILAVCAVTGSAQKGYAKTTSLSDITSDSIKEKENQISEAQKEKKVLESGMTDVKKMVAELSSVKGDLEAYVTKLDGNLDTIQAKISEIKQLISEKEEEIKITSEELKEAEATEKKQYEEMKSRIRFMYERGSGFYLEVLLSAESFGDMLNKTDYIEKLSAYDRSMLDSYIENREQIEAYKVQLEEEQATLEEAREAVEQEEAALNTLIAEKEQQIDLYESDISNKEQIIKQYEAEIAAQNAEIAALEAAVLEERKRIAAQNGAVKTYDGGQFKWPAPSYTRISDDYGYRIHPILKVQQFHNGVDMAAPSGSPILAAYDGEVVAASYSSSMGNYIMIDHGDGLYTIYMHASALYVSKGQTVARGEKIAAVGSTGRSTGPHLHFSVRLNGSYVSPWNYLSS